jgi:hypothetical protein
MTDYYLLLAVTIGGLMNATPERRAAVYEKARVAMLERLRSSNPPISEAEIARESQAFEEAVARLENELSPSPVPVERAAQRGARSSRPTRPEKPARRERPKAPPTTRPEPFVPEADVLAALRPTSALGLGEPLAPVADRNTRPGAPEPIRAQRVTDAPPMPQTPFVATAPIAAAPPPPRELPPIVATAPVAAAPSPPRELPPVVATAPVAAAPPPPPELPPIVATAPVAAAPPPPPELPPVVATAAVAAAPPPPPELPPVVAAAPIAAAPTPPRELAPIVVTAPIAEVPPPPVVAMPPVPVGEDRAEALEVPLVAETQRLVAVSIEPEVEPGRATQPASRLLADAEPEVAMAVQPQPIPEVIRAEEPIPAQKPVETKAEPAPKSAATPEKEQAKPRPLLRLTSSIAAIPEAEQIKVEPPQKPRGSDLFKLKTVPAPAPKPPQPKVEVRPKAVETPAKALPAASAKEMPSAIPIASEVAVMSNVSAVGAKAAPKRMLRDGPLDMPIEQQPRAVAKAGRRAAPSVDTSWALPRWKTAPERRSSLSGVRPSSARALPPMRGPVTRQVAAQAVDRGFGARRTDRALIAAGVVMAFVSGAFGIFMNLPETEALRRANEQAMALTFPIDADTTVADDAAAPAPAAAPQQVAEAAPVQPIAAVDPVVTGSIAPAPRRVVRRIDIDNVPAADPPAANPPAASDSAASAPTLKDYHIRDVYQDMALIEGPHGLTLVKRGAKLQGAGMVTAIEKRDSKWVIDTSEGTIAQD